MPQLGGWDICKNKKLPPFAGGLLVIMLVLNITAAAKLHCKNIKYFLVLLFHASNCCSHRKALQDLHRERLSPLSSQVGTMRKFSNFQTITTVPVLVATANAESFPFIHLLELIRTFLNSEQFPVLRKKCLHILNPL